MSDLSHLGTVPVASLMEYATFKIDDLTVW